MTKARSMVHLLPIRGILGLVAALVAVAVLAATYTGWIGDGDAVGDATAVIRWSSSLATAVIVLSYAAWRWLKPVQLLIFPYLGGRWSGSVKFQGEKGPECRDVRLEVNHSPFRMKFLLDSTESSSQTLVVHAERDRDFDRYRIYYVYLNERKEGVEGAGDRYRGLAILRVECGSRPKLHGDYFTETHRRGTLNLVRDAAHPWWKLWR
jgi:hypothetical protein